MLPRLFSKGFTVCDVAQGVLWDRMRFEAEVAKRARRLLDGGFGAGDLAVVPHGNSCHFFADLLAVWSRGGGAIPFDPRASEIETANVIAHSGARAVLYRGSPPDGVLEEWKRRGLVTYDTLEMDESPGPLSRVPAEDPPLDGIALILYTSGTTGEPKGVVHTFRTLLAKWHLLAPYVPCSRVGRTACLLPTHFGHGLICNCLYPLYLGATLYLFPSGSLHFLQDLGEAIDAHGITFLSSVPATWGILLRGARPPRGGSLRLVHCGSAPLSARLWQGIRDWTGIRDVRNLYGITEVGSWTAGSLDPEAPLADGFIGPAWGARIAVFPEGSFERDDGELQPAGPGEVGEIWLQSAALMQGYYKRPDLSRSVVRGGWFLTGDLGFLDERGSLTLVGRRTDQINRGGVKVYPQDIDLLLEQHPEIARACTFSLADPVTGETVAAAISPAVSDSRIDLVKLSEWCRRRVSDYKVPSRWFVLNEIPTTDRGKINRDIVRETCLKLMRS